MKYLIVTLLGLCCYLGCTKNDLCRFEQGKSCDETAVVDKSPAVSVIVDKPEPVAVESTAPLSWEKSHPERKVWSDLARTTAGVVLRDLNKAKDVARFCPKYASLSTFDRVQFWAELVSTMAYFESGWKPDTVFKEPAPLNNESIGLLQLSVSDAKNYPFCAPIGTRSAIMDPLKNLDCGIRIMAKWIGKHEKVTGSHFEVNSKGKTVELFEGGSIYWSVLREKRKLPEVLAMVKKLGICR